MKKGIWLLLVLAVWCLSVTLTQAASPVGDIQKLRQWQQRVEQHRDVLSQQSDRLSTIEQAALGYLQILQDHIEITDTKIQDYEYQLQKANQELKYLQADLTAAQKSYQPKLKATVTRLRFLQRQPLSHQGWEILLKSENWYEWSDRRNRLKLVYQADRESLHQLQQEADKIKQQQITIETQKNQIALIQQQLLAQKAQIESQSAIQQQLIDRLNGDRRALEAAEVQLDKDSETIGILIRERVARQNYQRLGSGKLAYPNEGKISSGFGWRLHPILKYQRFHAGIDFAGSYGSKIYAADSGIVIFAGWYGGYGNTVIIDHGKGLTTLYGHISKLYVSEGMKIRRGQAIAAVGSSGLSTGPHLHFEVRENGATVDPMPYL